jgi:hypothetical protein
MNESEWYISADSSKTKLKQANAMFSELTNINFSRDFNLFNGLSVSRRGSVRIPPPTEEDLSMRSPPEDRYGDTEHKEDEKV